MGYDRGMPVSFPPSPFSSEHLHRCLQRVLRGVRLGCWKGIKRPFGQPDGHIYYRDQGWDFYCAKTSLTCTLFDTHMPTPTFPDPLTPSLLPTPPFCCRVCLILAVG